MNPIAGIRGVAATWGSTEAERALEFACDRFVADPDDALYRAVTVEAPPAALFRWLCQLRAAPYSYDLIDNLGRRSPRSLTPGLERLEVGQRMMTVFRLVAFEPDRHITAVLHRPRPLFAELAVTYLIVPETADRCRLVAKVAVAYPRGPIGATTRAVLPIGDLVMMRKQLLTLSGLAQRDARERGEPGRPRTPSPPAGSPGAGRAGGEAPAPSS
jgi:hypothetical protein